MSTAVSNTAPVGPALSDVATMSRPTASQAWRELAARARHSNPFQGPDLLGPAVRHLAGPADVRLLTLPSSDGTGLDLLLPVALHQRAAHCPIRATVAWRHTHHFLGTPLVADRVGPEEWRTALATLEREGGDSWLLLPGIDVDVALDIEEAARRDGRTSRRLRTELRPTTQRHPTNDYVERQLPGKRRKELRRVRRRLDEAVGGGLELVDLVDTGHLEDGILQFLKLEAAGWKGTEGGAIDNRPDERDFFVEACRAMAGHGGLEILALQGRDLTPVAMAVNFRTDDTLFTAKIAYDEGNAAYSPGLLLYLEQLTRFHESGARLLDTCAEPGHPMAVRLHPDRRELVTLAVALRPGLGHAAVRCATAIRRIADRTRTIRQSDHDHARKGTTMSSLLRLDEESRRALRTAGETGEPQEVTHSLRSHELLTLESLADFGASLPEDSVEHNVGRLPDVVADGNAPRLDLELREMILGLETNGAWCVLKNIEQDPRYSALLDACLDEIEDLVSGPGQAYKREGFIFLSAPGSMTPSHIDPEHNVLLQVHGTKTMVTGSWSSPEARAAEAERLVGGGHRNLQEDVQEPVEHQLQPGDGIYVPPYTQHKVINGPALSISLSVTWRSRALSDETKVLRANSYLRKVGVSPAAPGGRPAVDKAKSTAISAAEKAKAALRRGH